MSFLSSLFDYALDTSPTVNTDGTPMLSGGCIDIEGKPFGMSHEQAFPSTFESNSFSSSFSDPFSSF